LIQTTRDVTDRRAADLYRDDLYQPAGGRIVVERERLRMRYLTLLAQMAEQYYQKGDYHTCLDYLWQLLARDPGREDAHRLIMRCFVRCGERAAALRQYQVCTDLLRAEFDAEPEPATAALLEQIRDRPHSI
jgi:DNA-binding SARP family transcriptional activator